MLCYVALCCDELCWPRCVVLRCVPLRCVWLCSFRCVCRVVMCCVAFFYGALLVCVVFL